jgi:putative FmdB family regulatory protein
LTVQPVAAHDLGMALYEYVCGGCGTRTDKRMPMSDVLQSIPCPKCGKQASKAIGGFAVVGMSRAGVEDGPAPWESDGGDGGDDHGHSHDHGHGHSHGPGGHSHSHGFDDLDF